MNTRHRVKLLGRKFSEKLGTYYYAYIIFTIPHKNHADHNMIQ